MEPDGSLPHSQVPATCPYPEPDESSPYPNITYKAYIHGHWVLLPCLKTDAQPGSETSCLIKKSENGQIPHPKPSSPPAPSKNKEEFVGESRCTAL